jgi:hypothetical protein
MTGETGSSSDDAGSRKVAGGRGETRGVIQGESEENGGAYNVLPSEGAQETSRTREHAGIGGERIDDSDKAGEGGRSSGDARGQVADASHDKPAVETLGQPPLPDPLVA